MKLKKYLNENEQRDRAILVRKRYFKQLGLKFYSKWEEFIKNNMEVINRETEKIKKANSIIADEKRRNKKIKDEMRDFKNELTDLWSAMKK